MPQKLLAQALAALDASGLPTPLRLRALADMVCVNRNSPVGHFKNWR
jgi:hypothetical protein